MNQPFESESWKKMVLRSMPPPAWLSEDAPQGDVVLSTRVRFARNLAGFAFPHRLEPDGLRQIQKLIRDAVQNLNLPLELHKRLSEAEQDYLISCRLISPDFAHRELGRVVLLDEKRSFSLMVNEEDHIRLQALTAGWSVPSAQAIANAYLAPLERELPPAKDRIRGYLTSSPFNAGLARRLSVMVHVVGLGQTGRLQAVLQALASSNLVVRGLFGESSRAVGAFVQVSTHDLPEADFVGACDYLVREERTARQEFGRENLRERAMQAIDFAVAQPKLKLSDALRVLSWVRWCSASELDGVPQSPRVVDGWLTTLEVRGTTDPEVAARRRAESLRHLLER